MPSPAVQNTIAGIFGALALATIITLILSLTRKERDYRELKLRMRSWWIMVVVLMLALVVHPTISIIFFAFISFLALKEYLSLIPTRRADRRVLFWAYLSLPFQYYWVSIEWYGMFIIFIPVYMFLFLPFRMILVGESKGFLQAVGTLQWGLMTTVFSISHIPYLLVLPDEMNPAGGGVAMVLFLILLTEVNDISQYIWGKSFGREKIVPAISPNKTRAGFIGGVLTTILLSLVVAPFLTPFSTIHALCIGALLGTSGFIGDVVISAVKRDLEIKDTGTLLPGHGGILDRIDSLTYTAPLFFHYSYYFLY